MEKNEIALDFLRNKVINSALFSITILIFPVLFFSSLRYYEYGWQNYFTIYLIELFCILFLYFSKSKTSLKFKTHSITIISISFGLIGTSIFSLSGGHFQSIIGLIIVTLIYGRRLGLFYAIVAIVGYAIVGILILKGIIVRQMDFNLFNYSLYPWFNAISLYAVVSLLIIYSIGLFYKYYIGSLKEIINTKEELTHLNKELIENKKILEDKNNTLKELNKEYLENQIKFKTIFDIVGVGISITDEQGQVLDCNNSSDRILGITREEHLSKDYKFTELKAIHPDNTPMTKDEYPGIKVLKINQPISNIEMGIINKNNEVKWISVDAIPLNIEGYGAVVTYSDITERKNAQEKLISYSKELNILNSDKDKFIRILAHDLKNPFNSLIGFSTLLLENIDSFDIDTIKKQLGIINDTSIKTYDMLEEVLLWLKSQSGQLVFNPSNISFFEICNEVIQSSMIIANDKNITINCHYLNNSSKIFVDSNMTKTIMRNLVSNAIKFTLPDGEINIYEEIVGKEMIITISDNGIGISKENIDKIWNPMQTDKTVGTSGERGTGLGLSICKEFVERQAGRIWVESELGKGSSFKFSMPLSNKDIL